ncbi:hypothetical protein Q9233_006676, partial [Columba guinea]
KVYVKMNHNSPPILCLTNHLQNVEVIDPIFQWYGPGGSLSSENSNVEIAPTGTLILKHFNLSGAYNCSIVYKLTTMQLHRKHIIKYLIYGKLSIQTGTLHSPTPVSTQEADPCSAGIVTDTFLADTGVVPENLKQSALKLD